MSDEPENTGKLKERVASAEKMIQLLAKGLYALDTALEDWEGERVVAAGEIAGVKFPGAE